MKVNIFLIVLLLCSCENSKWTDKERTDFKKKCEGQVYFDTNPIYFSGFEFNEIDTVMIVEKEALVALDTLYIYLESESGKKVYRRIRYSGTPKVQFNISHTYEFYLGSDKPYVLSNMEMIMSPQPVAGEGWGCVMRNYSIDKNTFKDKGNINFTKRSSE